MIYWSVHKVWDVFVPRTHPLLSHRQNIESSATFPWWPNSAHGCTLMFHSTTAVLDTGELHFPFNKPAEQDTTGALWSGMPSKVAGTSGTSGHPAQLDPACAHTYTSGMQDSAAVGHAARLMPAPPLPASSPVPSHHLPAAPAYAQGPPAAAAPAPAPRVPREPFPLLSSTQTPMVCADVPPASRMGDCLQGNFKPGWTLLIWNEFTGLDFWQVFLFR